MMGYGGLYTFPPWLLMFIQSKAKGGGIDDARDYYSGIYIIISY